MCTRKRKNGVDAVEETVFKKTSKHPYTTDGFYTACKVGCCGGRGAEETWNPSVRGKCQFNLCIAQEIFVALNTEISVF